MRTSDRVLAVLLAVGGIAAGVLLTLEIGYRALGNTGHLLVPYGSTADFLARNAWSSSAVLVIGAALAVLGLVLLVAELRPRRPALLVLESGHPDVTSALHRRSVTRVVQQAADDVPGVASTSARLRGQRLALTTRTPLTEPGELGTAVESAATTALTRLHLRRTPSVSVRIQGGSS